MLESVAKLLTLQTPQWEGNASELIFTVGLTDLQPNVLTRKLNVNVERLRNEYGICIETCRNNQGRLVKLTLCEPQEK